MKSLFLIPARGGSKGLVEKNIRPLLGKPLILYSIELARQFTSDEMICVSTDDSEIANVVKGVGLDLPFIRPSELATDEAGSFDVIKHALNHYESLGFNFDNVVLLQPTSPLRSRFHLDETMALYNSDIDAVVSVVESSSNPYYNLFEEDQNGFLKKSKQMNVNRRQEIPNVYELNGAIYILNSSSIHQFHSISQMSNIVKYVMEKKYAIDIDDIDDFNYCEFLLSKKIVKI